jgi:hypothetical protein
MAQKPVQGTHFNNVISGATTAKNAAYTVVIGTDCGKQFTSWVTGFVYTLPAIATGNTFTFINTGDDGTNELTISPNSSDGISLKGASVDDTDIKNTKATSKKGDFVKLASFDGADHWQVVDSLGVWVHA